VNTDDDGRLSLGDFPTRLITAVTARGAAQVDPMRTLRGE